jgi:hypothetical protein
VTFYIDASVPVAVRRAVAALRTDVRYAGGPGAPEESARDVKWLPIAGQERWIVVKRDKKIRTRPGERKALIDAGLRTFCLTGAGNYTRWEIMRLLAVRWPRIEAIATENPGPYVYGVTWAGVRRLPLAGVNPPPN